jgi:phosphoribosylanthranilate isomerase
MRTRIKVCGFRRAEDLRAAAALGIDAVGLNLARGPRRLELDEAVALAASVPPLLTLVALFVDAPREQVLAQATRLRAAVVQLHGDETPEDAAWLRARMPVIKAFRIRSSADLDACDGYPADAYLLDACVPGVHGGSGATWDHRLLAGRRLAAPVILAGGLTPANAAAAVAACRPWAIDTASGVESAPAIKDPAALAALVAAVHHADGSATP